MAAAKTLLGEAGRTDFTRPPEQPNTLRGGQKLLRNAMLFLALLLLCIVVRFPYYFISVINWDESTFILMGQSVLNGNLPYVELWDNKPPLAFLFFVPVIALWKSIIAVRIAGTICVLIAAYLTYNIGSRTWNRETGFLAAIFSVVFVSVVPSGQATMTEIISLVPTMGALLILLRQSSRLSELLITGCLLSIATLIRTNLGYLVLAVGIFIVCLNAHQGPARLLRASGAYIMGGLIPLSVVFLPYALTNNSALFFRSVFLAPLSYVETLYSPTKALMTTIIGLGLTSAVLGFSFLGGVIVTATRWKKYNHKERCQFMFLATFLFAIGWSIISSGSIHLHYVIQLVPLLSLFAGYFFSYLGDYIPRVLWLILLLIGILIPASPVIEQYRLVADKLGSNEPLQSDPGFQIAAYIKEHDPSNEPIYMMTDHIVYWLTGIPPIAKSVTHPSTIAREYLLKTFLGPDASTNNEMEKILAEKPLFVVKRELDDYLPESATLILRNNLSQKYTLVQVIEGRYIYRRNEK